jgi:polar amino acid transport system substrate-binding protein
MAQSFSRNDCLSMYVVINSSSGYINSEGDLAGYHVDLLNEIEKRSGICITKTLLPYSRALRGLEYGKYDGGVLARTNKLDSQVKYITKLITSKTVIIPRKGFTITSYQDLTQIVIGRFRGVDLNDNRFKKYRLSLVELQSYKHGLYMLKRGRIDAIAGNNLGLSIINDLNMANEVNLAGQLVVGQREVWLAFSNKSKKLDQVDKIQKTTQAIVDEGVLDNILQKYFGANWELKTK